MQRHTEFWQSLNAKDEAKGFGVKVANTWYWYENWLQEVEKHCKQNENVFK